MPNRCSCGNSRQRILQVVKAVSISIDYVLTAGGLSISPTARAELTSMLIAYFWEVDSPLIITRAIELLTDMEEGMDNNNISELFQKSVTPIQVAPIYNIEFKANKIGTLVVSQPPEQAPPKKPDD